MYKFVPVNNTLLSAINMRVQSIKQYKLCKDILFTVCCLLEVVLIYTGTKVADMGVLSACVAYQDVKAIKTGLHVILLPFTCVSLLHGFPLALK